MKKFLTVLLALSVVFTYSFAGIGTAFADTDLTQSETVTQEVTAMTKAVKDYTDSLGYNASGTTTIDTVEYTKTAVDAGAAAVVKKYTQLISVAAENAAANAGWNYAVDQPVVNNAWYNDMKADGAIKDLIVPYANEASYTELQATAKSLVASVDLTKYYATDQETIKPLVTAVTDAAAKDYSAENANALKGAITTLKTAITDTKTVAEEKTELAKYQSEKKAEVKKHADAFKTAYKALLEEESKNVATAPAANAKLATLDADCAKVLASFNAEIDAQEIATTPAEKKLEAAKTAIDKVVTEAVKVYNTSDYNNFTAKVNTLATKDLLVAYAKKYAAEMKTQYTTDGNLKYFPATVDKALEAAIAGINGGTLKTYADVETELNKTQTAAAETKALDDARKTDLATLESFNYTAYTVNEAAIKAVVQKYIDKVNLATTLDEITKLMTEYDAEKAAILTDDNINTLKGKVHDAAVAENYVSNDSVTAGSFGAYASAKNTAAGNVYSATIIEAACQKAYDVLVNAVLDQQNQKMFAVGDTQIKTIIKAKYTTALKEIDAMKTAEQVKADVDAANKLIEALPAEVKLTDKDQVVAAAKKANEVKAEGGTLDTLAAHKLEAAATKILALAKAEAEAKINALPGTILVSDKDAIEAAQAAVDEFNALVKEMGVTGSIDTATAKKLSDAQSALSAARQLEVAKLIQALPAEPTLDDKAAVEAARAAYDELTDSEKAAFSKVALAKLEAAEASVKAAVDVKNAEIKGGVKATTIKAKATAGKKYIKLTWKKSAGYKVDGYKVYRATKKNGTYKLVKTTKSTSFKNTKLKSGKTYYYKVRGYRTVDGKKVYTQYSAKVYKKAK